MYNNELYHYGVKGMKWGHRKALPKSDLRKRYDKAKVNKLKANAMYSVSYKNAYNRSSNPIPYALTKNGRTKTNAAWERAMSDANRAIAADRKFKQVKKERKQAIKSTYKDVQKKTGFGEKMLFGNSTRKKAAKYMVDNDMSMADAKKKANKQAIRNTAIILGAIGAVAVAQRYSTRPKAGGPMRITKNKFYDPIDVAYKVLS